MTYPIEGFPWRRNPCKSSEFEIGAELSTCLFDEVATIQECSPGHCLPDDVLWCDHAEKANGITRDQETDTLCHTIAIYDRDWQSTVSVRAAHQHRSRQGEGLGYDGGHVYPTTLHPAGS